MAAQVGIIRTVVTADAVEIGDKLECVAPFRSRSSQLFALILVSIPKKLVARPNTGKTGKPLEMSGLRHQPEI